jgi:hypothetical protein
MTQPVAQTPNQGSGTGRSRAAWEQEESVP